MATDKRPAKVQAVPEKAEGRITDAEREVWEEHKNGSDNLFEPGINVGEGSYDPNAGSSYEKNERPNQEATPVFFASRSDDSSEDRKPSPAPAKVISRDKNVAVERSEVPSGRKAEAKP